jgi:hypothetical protein
MKIEVMCTADDYAANPDMAEEHLERVAHGLAARRGLEVREYLKAAPAHREPGMCIIRVADCSDAPAFGG